MTNKSWFCGLLTAAVLFCGCNSETASETVSEKVKEPVPQTIAVELQTSMGDIVIELNEQAAPVTVNNFLRYVEDGFYDGTIFHRVIHRFMIQGGGFTPEMKRKQTRDPIANEAGNGLKNKRGTIAMARGPDPDSATCQFFINHMANPGLDYVPNRNPGYAVFGKVVEGMDVVDAIAWVETTTRAGRDNVPVRPVVIKSAKVISR
ncbi:MAG: peptidyl-prolyl cis-trans isomerase [Phycisphaerales bacterium]|nr:MAG: peptidyl-prolyl cis-trans isomerase [Phycisphaerales bacterium]UCF16060.1 MAG: peptidyl-prolyl cis-trans isomerase [Phycisphaerales bacterium]